MEVYTHLHNIYIYICMYKIYIHTYKIYAYIIRTHIGSHNCLGWKRPSHTHIQTHAHIYKRYIYKDTAQGLKLTHDLLTI